MWAFLVTLVLLGCFLLWVRAWQRGSRFASGIAIGAAVVLIGGPLVRSATQVEPFPVWAPALPFALIAITLFGFGLLAWFWGEQ
ncbi:MAG TPA: hypothetical protein VFP48_04465 [Steroidobacteraceae bacterium]|nr:hypothetical protein [Steroidobacteraceae bacterium]